jgi:mannose-1-phosphate guanylyltransferase/mannose-6-phosphate isomerase
MSLKIQPVILSGGSGSRLWPMSRAMYPKQLLPMVTDKSLLQDTVSRINHLGVTYKNLEVLDPVIVCNEAHRFFVAEQMLELGKSKSQIILEPVGKNTAPALTLAALSAVTHDKETIVLVMPADHVIKDIKTFHSIIAEGAELAEEHHLVTFGITPTHAETGYGYIRKGSLIENNKSEATTIAQFVEKPELSTAEGYLESGDYLWNSGMFMMKASDWLAAIAHFNPEMASCVETAWKNGIQDHDFYRVDKKVFENCPSDSIDYAVMEKVVASPLNEISTAVIALDAGWSDVGAWSSLWDVSDKDESGNVTRGDVFVHDSKNCLIYSENRHIAGIGLDNLVIVETADALLVSNKENAQDVKHAVAWLKNESRDEHIIHRKVYRPWGCYEGIDSGDRYQVKRISVKVGASLSLQLHHHRAEHWIVVKGTAQVTRGDDVFLLTENESTYIPLGVKHRLENKGSIPLDMIEVQSGSYLGEDDIVRFDDVYGRESDKT